MTQIDQSVILTFKGNKTEMSANQIVCFVSFILHVTVPVQVLPVFDPFLTHLSSQLLDSITLFRHPCFFFY